VQISQKVLPGQNVNRLTALQISPDMERTTVYAGAVLLLE
jgi:hypothetical protein